MRIARAVWRLIAILLVFSAVKPPPARAAENPLEISTEDNAAITAVAFAPGGAALAVGLATSATPYGEGDTFGLRLLDLKSPIARVEFPVHADEVTALLYAPDGATLISQTRDDTVEVWDTATGHLRATLARGVPRPELQEWEYNDLRSFRIAAVSPNSKWLAGIDSPPVNSTGDSEVKIWNLADGKLTGTLKVPSARILHCLIAPDGKMLDALVAYEVRNAWASLQVQHWDIQNGAMDHAVTLSKTIDSISACMSEDGKLAAGFGNEPTPRGTMPRFKRSFHVWNAATGEESTVPQEAPVENTANRLATDGTLVTTGKDGTLVVCNVLTGHILKRLPATTCRMPTVGATPDLKKLVCVDSESGFAHAWDLALPATLIPAMATLPSGHAPIAVFAGDSSHVVAATDQNAIVVSQWDMGTQQSIKIAVPEKRRLGRMAFSPQRNLLAAPIEETVENRRHTNAVAVWDIAAKTLLCEVPANTGEAGAIAFSPDSRVLATGCDPGGKVQLWSLPGGALLHAFPDSQPGVPALAFSPDGTLLATATERGVQIWDAATFNEVYSIPYEGQTNYIAFSPSGKLLLVGSFRETRLLDVATGRTLWRTSPDGKGTFVAFSPDGKRIAVSFYDFNRLRGETRIEIRDLESSELLQTIIDPCGDGGGVFAPDGRALLTISTNDIKIWPLGP